MANKLKVLCLFNFLHVVKMQHRHFKSKKKKEIKQLFNIYTNNLVNIKNIYFFIIKT